MPEMLLTILLPIIRKTRWLSDEDKRIVRAPSLHTYIMISADLADVLPFVQGRPLVTDPLLIERIRKTSSPSIDAPVSRVSGLILPAVLICVVVSKGPIHSKVT